MVNVCLRNGVSIAITFPSCTPITINHSLLYSAIMSMDGAERRNKRSGRRPRRKQATEETTTAASDTSDSSKELKATVTTELVNPEHSEPTQNRHIGAHPHIAETPAPHLAEPKTTTPKQPDNKDEAHFDIAETPEQQITAGTQRVATPYKPCSTPLQHELFAQSAVLHQFGAGKWKARGVGEAKLLNCDDGHVRFMMREHSTMKTIADHYAPDSVLHGEHYCELAPCARGEHCWQWTALDFADDELKVKKFALEFMCKEQAEKFKENFTSVRT